MGDSQVKPRYHHLLSTNDEPSSSERTEIQKIVEKRESAIGQLEAQIIELEETLNVLKDRHKREKDLLFPFHSALAPIRRVPCDILIEIFLFTRDWTDGSSVIRGLAPITIGITHVCSHWRRVALSVPMLWSIMEATCRTRDGEGTYSFNDSQIQTWLSRAGSLSPLDIICRAPYQASVSPTWMNQYQAVL